MTLFQCGLILASGVLYPADSNILKGLEATFDPQPTYDLCTDAEDSKQLTDGIRVEDVRGGRESALWGFQEAVGWQHSRELVWIQFDLGARHDFEKASVSTAGGSASVQWPLAIGVFASDDGETWAFTGDLAAQTPDAPKPDDSREFIYRGEGLKGAGRHVAFVILSPGSPFFFSDEVQLVGRKSAAGETAAGTLAGREGVRKFLSDKSVSLAAQRRLNYDVQAASKVIAGVRKRNPAKAGDLAARLDTLAKKVGAFETPQSGFRTELPLGPLHEEILGIYGESRAAAGAPHFEAGKLHRYAWLPWLPSDGQSFDPLPESVSIRSLRGETRSESLWLQNNSPARLTVKVALSGSTAGMELKSTRWTDSPSLEPYAAALLPVDLKDGRGEIVLPPGLGAKLWIASDARKAEPGKSTAELTISAEDTDPRKISIQREILPLGPQAPTLRLGLWDYTNGEGMYGITPSNLKAAVAFMQAGDVDSPWASNSVLPWPADTDFNAADEYTGTLNFQAFDNWVARWPDAKRYMVFFNVPQGIGGQAEGTVAFQNRLRSWAAKFNEALVQRGLGGKVYALLKDEPGNAEHDERLLKWLIPFADAAPDVITWSDPVWTDPESSPHRDAFTRPDVLCPNLNSIMRGGDRARAFYLERAQAGQRMELYQCAANMPTTNPSVYFRLLPWFGWQFQIEGVGFWSMGDLGGLRSLWNAYEGSRGVIYTPAFVGADDVNDAVAWHAIQDGRWDYEAFLLLKAAHAKSEAAEWKSAAEKLLDPAAIQPILDRQSPYDQAGWPAATTETLQAPDDFRSQVLDLLTQSLSQP